MVKNLISNKKLLDAEGPWRKSSVLKLMEELWLDTAN